MQPLATLLSLLTLTSTTLATPLAQPAEQPPTQTVSVSYDKKYDAGGTSLTTVACSNGVNGLIPQGYSTFDSLPNFPMIGAAPTITGWNSPNCGNCYRLHFKAGNVDGTVYVTAVDAAPGGFNLGLQAMDQLTDGMAVHLGRVDATYSEADPAKCGFGA